MAKNENTKFRRLAVRMACAVVVMGVCAGLVPGAVQAQDKKFLIGIVELQLTNPFFGKLKKAAVDPPRSMGWKS